MKILDVNGDFLLNVPGNTLRYADLRYVNLQYANFRKADLRDADFKDADLRNAKLLFAELSRVHLWRANLQNADLRYADLWRADLWRADLREADLREADLRNADLQYAEFSEAELKGARLPHFEETPVIPNIHKAVYEAASAPDALDMGVWHVCATTHCRAGWVVALAGEAGRALEAKIGTDAAAALIYMKSDPNLEQIPDWHTNDEEALEDMRRLAA